MKWCMVAALAVSLLFGGVAFAQEDNFDLDALLGDVGTAADPAAAPATEPAPAEVAAPAAALADEAAVEEVADTATAAVDEVGAAAEAAMGEIVDTAQTAMEDIATPAEEPAEAMAETAAPAEEVAVDPFADLAAEPAAEVAPEAAPAAEAPAEEAAIPAEEMALPVEEPAAPVEEALAPAEEVAVPAAEDDLLGDLLGEEPAAEEAAAAPVAEEPLPADLFAAEPAAEMPAEEAPAFDEGFAPAGEEAGMPAEEGLEPIAEESADFAPAARKKAGKEAEKLSPKELKKVAKEAAAQEEVRRQADEITARQGAEAGFKALSDGDYITAEESFTKALNTLPDRPQTADLRDQISWGLSEAQYLRARAMVQKKERLADARKLVDAALKGTPDHRGAQALDKRLKKLEAYEAMPKDPEDQSATIEKTQSLEQMYDEARQWYMLKDFDRANALFEQILLRDPYHKSAMRYLRKIEADKYKLATYERDARVQEMMTDVRRSWSPPIRAQIEVPEDMAGKGGVESKPASQRLQEKLREIKFKVLDFRQGNINDVVRILVDESRLADPEKEGVNIILNLDQAGGGAAAAPAPAMPAEGAAPVDEWGFGGEDFGAPAPMAGGPGIRTITLNMRNITMLDAIKYITEVANLKYRIEESAVIITPIDAPVGSIITRMYPVQPSFMDVIVERQDAPAEQSDQEFTSMGGRVSVTKSDVKEFFEKTGVKFPSGASITYNSSISQLIVANTADNLETFERILQQLNVVPNQVEIEARFIEVDQGDLEELGLQWILNDNYEFATKTDGSGGRLQVNANSKGVTQGNRFFNYNTGNLNVEPASTITRTANQTMLGGILSASSVLTNPEFTIVLQALSQHGGSDLLSAPRVTTRSGVNAQIQVVKEIIYPTEFDVTQPTMNTEGNVTMSPVVTPGTFETRETGVILNVTPTVGPDGYTIDLVMAPEVAELVDWIQYGSEITVETGVIGARQQNTYLFNMPMPIFTSRNVTTSIVIWDGQTVVMGGLIREEMTTIKDKIPILGDIPLLGWLFRSDGSYSRKKNLLIFVTARLVDPAGRPIHREGTMAMPGEGLEAAPDTAAAPQ